MLPPDFYGVVAAWTYAAYALGSSHLRGDGHVCEVSCEASHTRHSQHSSLTFSIYGRSYDPSFATYALDVELSRARELEQVFTSEQLVWGQDQATIQSHMARPTGHHAH